MLIYALKSAVVLTMLYACFALLLSRETFHRLNRALLLLVLVASMVMPVIHIETKHPIPIATGWQRGYPYRLIEQKITQEPIETAADAPVTIGQKDEMPVVVEIPEKPVVTVSQLLNQVYMIGLAGSILWFLYNLCLLVCSLRGGLRIADGKGNTIIIKGGDFAPFSFWRYIVINTSDYNHNRRFILTHEQEHIRQGHSLDLLLWQAVATVQWFNPFVWLLGRDLRAIHEYEADEAVINQGIDATQYQVLLVTKAVGGRLQMFANTFSHSKLKKRILMMKQTKSSPWRMLRVAFVIPVAAMALIAFASPESEVPDEPQATMTKAAAQAKPKPLVEYRVHDKVGKSYRDFYVVHLGEGVWVENGGQSYIEEQYFIHSYDNTRNKPIMMLNGVPFDQNSLPKLTSNDLKKIEVNNAGHKMLVEGKANGNHLNVDGEQMTVNLITTPVTIPSNVQGNVPRVQTLLLPGKGELYIKNDKAEPGDWMHSSVTCWEKTPYNYSVRNEFEHSKTKPGFKCYIYASIETQQKDISRAEALMQEMGIKNYEVVRNLPKKHFTDMELRQWAKNQKAKGTAYDKLFDAMAPEHMDCADVHRQWHIVKAVYGRK